MIRFYNGLTMTMDCGVSVTDDEVWVDGDIIKYVGPPTETRPEFEREIDLGGDLLMPGFKNAHAHSAMTFLRSFADDTPLHDWLYNQVFPREAKLTPEHVYAFTRLAILEYLTSGITSCFDMYFHPDAFASACTDSGFRAVLCGSIGASNEDWSSLERSYIKFNTHDPLISYKLGFHAEYTASVPMLEYVAKTAHSLKAPVWSHNSETRKEVDECIARHGKTPTQLFDSLGLYDYGGGGFHCAWLTQQDIQIIKNRGLWVVTCPCSNSKLSSGIAPLCKLMGNGVNLAMGTDGAASNNALDMFREMYLATVLQKLLLNDASVCDADAVLRAATVGSAQAMGLGDCDVIAPGKQADLIVLDMSQPNMRPLRNISKNIVYSGSKSDVRLTMVSGRVLYESGSFFIGEEPEAIYERAENMLRDFE